ncbi:ribonuclease Oy-like [Trichogramma pretiosum]|uniref:ribonuclease Oy-like n=1 Tax=Trichogramma pretiosum TaxID=7493 RepID=UPI000C71A658|nr:ribonuclease Oy-like [Trichogramma pretiosum]
MMIRELIAIFVLAMISDRILNSRSELVNNETIDLDVDEDEGFTVVTKKPQKPKAPSSTYNYFILSLMWPQTNCWYANMDYDSGDLDCSRCENMPADRGAWTIHGLWPAVDPYEGPEFCPGKPNQQYSAASIYPFLLEEMNRKWLAYRFGMGNDAFRRHEWNKHGTCSLDNAHTSTVNKYLNTTMTMYEKYEPSKFLQIENIVPGGQYKVRQISDAIQKHLKVTPAMHCMKNAKTRKQYFREIHICLDKSTLAPVDCYDRLVGNCNRKMPTILPKNLDPCLDNNVLLN